TTAASLVVDYALGQLEAIALTKVMGMALYGCGAILLTLGRGRSWRATVAIAVPSACLLTIVPGALGIMLHARLVGGFILSMVAPGGALVFPWGLRAHLAVIAMASAAFTANVLLYNRLSANVVVSVASAFAAAAYASAVVERQRLERKAIDLQ